MTNLTTLKLRASSTASPALVHDEPEPDAHVEEPRAPRPAGPSLKARLLMLAAIELAATLAAVAATGTIHDTIVRIAAAGLALAVAAVVAIEAFAPRRRAAAPARPAAPAAPRGGFSKSKVILLLVMAAGFATYFGNGGTFSSFSAETTNSGSNIASGTLTMSNTVNSQATACFSYNGAANVNSSCQNLFSLAGGTSPNTSSAAGNIGPALYGSVAQVKVENTGSLDASKLQLYAPTLTDCASSKAASNQVTGATVGSSLTFNSGNLCSSAIMYVQEVGTGHHYCWFGAAVPSSTAACAAPFSAAYAGGTTISGATSSIAFTGTPDGNIVAGDKIHVSQLNPGSQTYNVAECTATGTAPAVDVWMGDSTATSIPVGSCTIVSGVGTAFTSAAVVTDYTTTNTTLSGTFTSDTISNFDTTYGTLANAMTLYPTTGDGTDNNSGYGIGLPHYDSVNHTSARTFYVGVYLPTPPSTNQNTLQGLQAAFSLTWHIEQ